jgi:hypothetical protein
MEFTLDSVTQFKASLIDKLKPQSITETPVIIDDLTEITNQEKRYFFGILTVGTDTNAVLKNENDVEKITITSNSQIIDYFSSLEFKDDSDAPQLTPLGSFRGFEINVR